MALPRPAAALVALALSLAACGGSGGSSSPPPPGSGVARWIPVAGMTCADDSGTGIGISDGRPDKVLVYLSGGGACWSADACNAGLRRFSALDFTLLQASGLIAGTIFDRRLAGNPFADWTLVFVPYCTGDVHAGDTRRTYGTVTWNHHGWKNLEAAVGAITTDLSRPAELVVAGSSAGGFGALAAFDLARGVWDPAGGTSAALLDDSGPTLVGTAIPPALLSTWWDGWGLASTLGSFCPACAADLSAAWPALHARHPGDRLALLAVTQDWVMRGFFADPAYLPTVTRMDALAYEAGVDGLARSLDALGPEVGVLRIGGVNALRHAVLADGYFLPLAENRPALDWVSALVNGDPAWASSTMR